MKMFGLFEAYNYCNMICLAKSPLYEKKPNKPLTWHVYLERYPVWHIDTFKCTRYEKSNTLGKNKSFF